MKSLPIVQNLLKNTTTDFRFIPFGIVLIYLSLLLFSEFALGSYAIIGNYFRIYPIPYFVDLEILLCGVDAIREGLDPYQAICFEGEAYFNYPYIWGFLSVFPFMTAANHIAIGLIMAILFFALIYQFIGKINFKESLLYALVFISPAVMLGLERGNSDVLIFLILMSIPLLFYRSKWITSLLIIFTSFLKLFPIGAVVALFLGKKESFRHKALLVGVTIVSLTLYVYFLLENILQVSDKTPRPFKEASYGLGGFPSFIVDYFNVDMANRWVVFVSLGALLILAFLVVIKTLKISIERYVIQEDKKGVAFFMGSGIFLFTCLIGYNWEYRLIFLIFTLPQLFSWLRQGLYLAKLITATYIFLVWCSLIVPVFNLFIPDGFAYVIIYNLTIILFLSFSMSYFKFLEAYYFAEFKSNSISIKP